MTEKKKFKLSITILIIIAIILIDQVSKILVINFVKQDVGIITLSQKSEEIKIDDVIISILSDCVVFTVIIKFLKEQSKYMSTKVKYSLAVILGGGISNCIDKIWNGEVINFIKIGRLPSVNIAYILYIIGWISFLIFMVKNTLNIKADLKNIEEILLNIDLLKCDIYQDALIPIALVNKLVSLSNYPGSNIIRHFTKQNISE